jgi:hypothetical protein
VREWIDDSRGLVALLVITAAAYGALVFAGFVWDDIPLVLGNQDTGDLAGIGRFFGGDFWAGAGETSGYYRPFMLLSLALDRFLWEGSGAGHHLHSLGWHLLATWGLWRLLFVLLDGPRALVGATLFALHPVQSEAVAWIAARNDPMAAAFLFLGVGVLLPERVGPRRLVLGGLLLLSGLLSKESGVFGIFLLLGLDLARWGRIGSWSRYAVAGGALGIWATLRGLAGVRVRDLPDPAGWHLLAERGHEAVALSGKLLVWPWPLSVGRALEYLHEPASTVVLGLSVLLLGTVAALRFGGRLAGVGLLFAGLALAPAVLALAGKGLLGERYLYLPLGGIALAVAAAVPRREETAWVLLATVLGSMWVLQQRLPDWQNSLSLWESALRDTPSGFVYAGVGHELNRRSGLYRQAAEEADERGKPASAETHRAEERDMARQAGQHFAEALRADPPFYDVCTHAMLSPLRVGDQRMALAHARLAQQRGCDATTERVAIFASLLAQNGAWGEAASVVEGAEEDDAGRLALVRAAVGLLRGDPSSYGSLLSRSDLDPAVVKDQVRALLAAGGMEVRFPEDSVAEDPAPGETERAPGGTEPAP